MRKLFTFFAALLLTAGLWGETIDNVHCLDANGEELTIDSVNVVTGASERVTWGKAGKTTWYVVTNLVTLSKGADCQGDVRLILFSSRLTATGGDGQAGIQVSGEGNSLTIYRSAGSIGFLDANGGYIGGAGIGGNAGKYGSNITINGGVITATGSNSGAGIGGGDVGNGYNITINGGTITANGGTAAAGIGGGSGGNGTITINGGTITANGSWKAAGIGGGYHGNGSITITGGTITATGSEGPCIGSGDLSSGSANLSIPASYRIKIGKTYIHHNGTDLVNILADKTNVQAYPDKYFEVRNAAMAAIHAAVEGITNETILAMAAQGIEDIFQTEGGIDDIDKTKQKVLADLEYVLSFYNSGDAAGYARGKEEGKAEALGAMAEPCTDCMAVEVTDGTTTVTLYAPTGVDYIKK